MLQSLKKGFFPTLVALTALSVSASAAFYSVTGLSKLFAGASTEVFIMAGSLEVAKLVIATLLHRYWSTLNKVLKFYLTSAVVILVLITSMGIYGFLSAAYQETYSQLAVVGNEISYLEKKKQFYETDLQRYDKEIETILANINTLSSAKASSIQIKDTSSTTGYRQTISTTELRLAQKRIEVEEENKAKVQEKRTKASDSLQKYELKILQLQNNTEVAGELGPLKYISGLTGTPMDKIINWLLLVIIFVFDPLAVSLVIAASYAFEKAFPRKEYEKNLYGEKQEKNSIKKSKHNISNWIKENGDPEVSKVVDEEVEYIKEKIKQAEESGFVENFDKEEDVKELKSKQYKLKYNDGTEELVTSKELKNKLPDDDDDLKITYL